MKEFTWMLTFAVFILAVGKAVSAQDYPYNWQYQSPQSPNFDQLKIEDGLIENTALVTYANDAGLSSDVGTFTLTAPNGITVQAVIEINVDGEGRERITVLTSDEYAAWPVEADVLDGDEVTIQIMRPFS